MCSFATLLKTVLAYTVYHSGLFEFRLKNISKDRFLVLMYHRIIPKKEVGFFLQPGMYVEPKTFDMHLRFFKRHFDIRSVGELSNLPLVECMGQKKKHACYLTFDDGWLDFYKYAFPILVKHQVPATVFLPTGFIGTNKYLWTERVRLIFEALHIERRISEFKEFINTQINIDKYLCSVHNLQEELIKKLKHLPEDEIIAILGNIEKFFSLDIPKQKTDFLNWAQINEMAQSNLITFGAHSESHRILTNLTDEDIKYELHVPKLAIANNMSINNDSNAFCYPNGNYNSAVLKQLIKEEYRCAFTTHYGWNGPESPVYELKRVGLHQDISLNKQQLAYRIYSATD